MGTCWPLIGQVCLLAGRHLQEACVSCETDEPWAGLELEHGYFTPFHPDLQGPGEREWICVPWFLTELCLKKPRAATQ